MLEISKRLPESKSACPPEWAKYNRERIELPIAAEMMKRQSSQRKAPTLALWPIQYDSAVSKVRQDMLLDVVMPNRAIRIHKQNISASQTPPKPNNDTQTDARNSYEDNRQNQEYQEQWKQRQHKCNMPPFRFLLVRAVAHARE